jgi:predicted kinase
LPSCLFIVVTGLPGSGKSSLARRLAGALRLPLLDKDDFLERLFDERGIGDRRWRRTLSRESDRLFQEAAAASDGAVLVSFWHQPGMAPDSGTPTDWVARLSPEVVQVRCVCPVEVAAARFAARRRHPGHLDRDLTLEQLTAELEAFERLSPLELGIRVDVDTSQRPDIAEVVAEIHAAATRVKPAGRGTEDTE